MPFQKGKSGNPNGRPHGAKMGITMKVHHMFQDALNMLQESDNPLTVIAEIMNHPAIDNILEDIESDPKDVLQALRLRLQAASDLGNHIIPALPKELTINHNHFEIELTQEQIMQKLADVGLELAKLELKDIVSEQ